MEKRIAIILVLYNKSDVIIDNYIEDDNQYLVIVDNTDGQNLNIREPNVVYVPLLKNCGIAAAQNIGIKEAIKAECDYIVFFDQDSCIPNHYCRNIVILYEEYISKNPKLFLLGPTIINKQTHKKYRRFLNKKTDIESFKPQREIISSGSCVKVSQISKVGMLCERLFIDYVDFEWCWRSNYLGFVSGVTGQIALEHEVGRKELLIGCYHTIVSAKVRYYYQVRNFLALSKKKYVPVKWKVAKLVRLFADTIIFLFKRDYRPNIKYVLMGIKDGFLFRV